MIWLLLALAIAANIAALVSIAAWYGQRNDTTEWLYAEACTDALNLTDQRTEAVRAFYETAVLLERTEAVANSAADDVRMLQAGAAAHAIRHQCLPTIDAVRSGHYTPTAGDTPLYDAEAVVVPMRGRR